jgi:hypothetical protein
MPEVVFAIRLTNEDWDEVMRGWRCPVLSVPGAIVEAVYVEGSRIDSARYEVLPQNTFVRWIAADHPQRVAVSIKLTEALSLGSETERWKRLAIVLPVAATIMAAVISGSATYLSRSSEVHPASRISGTPTPDAANINGGPKPAQGTPQRSDGSAIDVIDSNNTTFGTELPIEVGKIYRSRFSGDDSSRYFKIRQADGEHDLTVEFSLVRPDTEVRPDIAIYDMHRTKLFSRYHESHDGGTIKWTAPVTAGSYVLEVKPSTSTGGFTQFLLSVNAGER